MSAHRNFPTMGDRARLREVEDETRRANIAVIILALALIISTINHEWRISGLEDTLDLWIAADAKGGAQ